MVFLNNGFNELVLRGKTENSQTSESCVWMKSLHSLNENLVMVRMAVMNCCDAYFSYPEPIGFFFSALSGLREVCSQGIPDEQVFFSFFQGAQS